MPKKQTPIHDVICDDCGRPFPTRYGHLCNACRHDLWAENGRATKGRSRKVQGSKTKPSAWAKCPKCGIIHNVQAIVEPGKLARIYCKNHYYLRYHEEEADI